MKFDVKIEGIKELMVRLKDPALVEGSVQGLIEEAAGKAYGVGRGRLSGGTEQAKISMALKTRPMEATVFSRMPQHRALSIEEGRRPGEWVPYMQAVHYVTGRRYLTSMRMNIHMRETGTYLLSYDEHRAIRKFQYSVVAFGSKAKKFIAGAAKAVKDDMPVMVDRVARKIEERWEARRK